ncbi:hypothetical protein ACKWTF_010998 [Chironomus riparius]
MNLVDGIKAAFSLLSSIFIVILVCFLGKIYQFIIEIFYMTRSHILLSVPSFFSGWFLVYKFFLLRFKVVRELLGQLNDTPEKSTNSSTETKVKSKKIRRD